MKTEISDEIARADFERFAETARLDLEKPRNANDRTDLEEQIELFVHYVRRGVIVVGDDGYPTVKTQSEHIPEVKFHSRPNTTALLAMDKVKRSNDTGKMIAMMASTLGISRGHLNTMELVDLEVVQLVFTFFLG